jgi:hypothetical protein
MPVRDGSNKVRAWEYLVTSGNPRLLRCMFVANVVMLSSLRLGSNPFVLVRVASRIAGLGALHTVYEIVLQTLTRLV